MIGASFQMLHPRIVEGLRELGISLPTPPQEKSMEPILTGENVLLVAPTASGKTEAALLPVFDMFLRTPDEGGIKIVYITPLRALNRDIERRLKFWSDRLGVGVQVRHGDTPQSVRRKQVSNPPEMLITTPETLQAILISSDLRRSLEGIRWVIVDEVHELASSKRGAQLTVGLERLKRLTPKPFQRIGLSATVGNPDEVAAFLGGVEPVKVIKVEVDKTFSYGIEYPTPSDDDFDLADELGTTPEGASRLRRMRDLVSDHRSTLIFVQGRGQAESLGHSLSRINPLIEVHHGSLSKEQRQQVEDRFKAADLKAIVCTSTLQLGIDIGQVDLCIQYLSPRQVSTLIQRVGRAGHRLGRRSEGVLLSAYGEDALECIVASEKAKRGELERTEMHIKPLDVLAHQVVGLALEEENIDLEKAFDCVNRAYPYAGLENVEFKELVRFLGSIGLISVKNGRLKALAKSRKYYYENLGMINDERRYPFINVITDRVIGTVGDEFWTLRARIGLNVILRGRIWRILQIDEERGVLFVIPSDDPLGALPGWDGELIPVPRRIAEEAGELRERIGELMIQLGSKEKAIETLRMELSVDEAALKAVAEEIKAQKITGFPLPTKKRIIIEAYDKYLIFHCSFGERINRTLGCVFDAVLSQRDLIYSWWNDPYRILVEATRKLDRFDLENIEGWLLHLTGDELARRLMEFMEARFPFGYKMKFIAERFGVIPKGKTLGADALEKVYVRFKDTPIYRETLREAYQEKLDLDSAKQIFSGIASGDVSIVRILTKTPSPLARHILENYLDVAELMVPTYAIDNQLDYMKKSVNSRTVRLACMGCGDWSITARVRQLNEMPRCEKCGSGLLAVLKRYQDPSVFLMLYNKHHKGEGLTDDEREILAHGRKTADMVLSYGRKAIVALMVHGVGPVTAYQALSKMRMNEKEFYSDLLKAKIQFMRTRQYWDDREKNRNVT